MVWFPAWSSGLKTWGPGRPWPVERRCLTRSFGKMWENRMMIWELDIKIWILCHKTEFWTLGHLGYGFLQGNSRITNRSFVDFLVGGLFCHVVHGCQFCSSQISLGTWNMFFYYFLTTNQTHYHQDFFLNTNLQTVAFTILQTNNSICSVVLKNHPLWTAVILGSLKTTSTNFTTHLRMFNTPQPLQTSNFYLISFFSSMSMLVNLWEKAFVGCRWLGLVPFLWSLCQL